MPCTIAYLDEAENDVAQAMAWYRARQGGLEQRFAKAIEQAILKLQKWPTA